MERVEIDVLRQEGGIGSDARVEIEMFGGLYQAEVAFGQLQVGATRQAAEDAEADRRHPDPREPFVARAGDAVEDDPGDPHRGIEAREAQGGGGGGLRLTRYVEHQHHRPAHPCGDVGARAIAGRAGARDAVEQPHRSLGEHQIGITGAVGQPVEHRRRHRPAVEVERRAPARGAVEGGIDIIGAALERLHGQPGVGEGAEEAEHHRRLAGARGGRGDHQARNGAGRHAASPRAKREPADCGRKRRS